MLSARTPFASNGNLPAMLSKIIAGEYHFRGKTWQGVSRKAINFVTFLMEVDPDLRPNAEQAKKHSWLLKPGASGEVDEVPSSVQLALSEKSTHINNADNSSSRSLASNTSFASSYQLLPCTHLGQTDFADQLGACSSPGASRRDFGKFSNSFKGSSSPLLRSRGSSPVGRGGFSSSPPGSPARMNTTRTRAVSPSRTPRPNPKLSNAISSGAGSYRSLEPLEGICEAKQLSSPVRSPLVMALVPVASRIPPSIQSSAATSGSVESRGSGQQDVGGVVVVDDDDDDLSMFVALKPKIVSMKSSGESESGSGGGSGASSSRGETASGGDDTRKAGGIHHKAHIRSSSKPESAIDALRVIGPSGDRSGFEVALLNSG